MFAGRTFRLLGHVRQVSPDGFDTLTVIGGFLGGLRHSSLLDGSSAKSLDGASAKYRAPKVVNRPHCALFSFFSGSSLDSRRSKRKTEKAGVGDVITRTEEHGDDSRDTPRRHGKEVTHEFRLVQVTRGIPRPADRWTRSIGGAR